MRRTESAAHKQNKREAWKRKERKFKVEPCGGGGIYSKKAFKGSRLPECTAVAPGTCTLSCSLVTHTDALAKTKPFL